MKASESTIFKIGGLQCDVNGCDYIDTTINADDYKNLIGTPCPKCEASLLTQADYDAIQEMLKMEKRLKDLGIPLKPKEGEPLFKANIKMDGSGKTEIQNLEIVQK